MVNLEKTLASIQEVIAAANLAATMTAEGITVKKPDGKEVYGCDNKGRTWCKEGWENEVSYLDYKINYPE